MPDERGREAAERARAALERAEELAARLEEIRDRRHVEPESSARAAALAEEAVERATLALSRAAEAHHRAADVHRKAAALLDQLGHPARAALHRHLAEVDDAEGDADERRPPTGSRHEDGPPPHPDELRGERSEEDEAG
jgi:predicted phage gp36 major capsid-like protein